MSPVPLRIIYKIDHISYNVIGLENLVKNIQENKTDKFEFKMDTPYFIFIQRNEFDKTYYVFSTDSQIHISTKLNISTLVSNKHITIVLKNKTKDMAYYREYEPDFFKAISNFTIVCVESYMKYIMHVPLLIQGKISKRYRIPQLNEFIEFIGMPLEVANLSESEKVPRIISHIIPELVNILTNKPNGDIIKPDDIFSLIQYYTLLSVDTYRMAIICDKHIKAQLMNDLPAIQLDYYNSQNIHKTKKTYDIIFNLESGEITNNLTIVI